jgi:hypothetical protein
MPLNFCFFVVVLRSHYTILTCTSVFCEPVWNGKCLVSWVLRKIRSYCMHVRVWPLLLLVDCKAVQGTSAFLHRNLSLEPKAGGRAVIPAGGWL